MSKSTMIELVEELEKLPQNDAIKEIIQEAKAGEFHDFKNKKYICGKLTLIEKLNELGLHKIRKDVIDGIYDEEPDDADRALVNSHLDEIINLISRSEKINTFHLNTTVMEKNEE